MFVHKDETLIALGINVLQTKNPYFDLTQKKPVLRAFKYNLSPCNKTLLNVTFDDEDNGIFRAVRSADKVIKAHCLPVE